MEPTSAELEDADKVGTGTLPTRSRWRAPTRCGEGRGQPRGERRHCRNQTGQADPADPDSPPATGAQTASTAVLHLIRRLLAHGRLPRLWRVPVGTTAGSRRGPVYLSPTLTDVSGGLESPKWVMWIADICTSAWGAHGSCGPTAEVVGYPPTPCQRATPVVTASRCAGRQRSRRTASRARRCRVCSRWPSWLTRRSQPSRSAAISA